MQKLYGCMHELWYFGYDASSTLPWLHTIQVSMSIPYIILYLFHLNIYTAQDQKCDGKTACSTKNQRTTNNTASSHTPCNQFMCFKLIYSYIHLHMTLTARVLPACLPHCIYPLSWVRVSMVSYSHFVYRGHIPRFDDTLFIERSNERNDWEKRALHNAHTHTHTPNLKHK